MALSSEVDRIELVRIAAHSGSVRVLAGDHAFRVDGSATVSVDGARATVETTHRVTVHVPVGTDVVVGTSSGRIDVRGPVGAVAVTSASGRIEIEEASSLDVRTRSGRVEIGRCLGPCRVASDSARVTVSECSSADVSTTSGRVQLRGAAGSVRAHCVSGSIDIAMADAHDVDAETVSGRVKVTYPAGVQFQRIGGGQPEAPQPTGPDAEPVCTVRARSVTGRVSVSDR